MNAPTSSPKTPSWLAVAKLKEVADHAIAETDGITGNTVIGVSGEFIPAYFAQEILDMVNKCRDAGLTT